MADPDSAIRARRERDAQHHAGVRLQNRAYGAVYNTLAAQEWPTSDRSRLAARVALAVFELYRATDAETLRRLADDEDFRQPMAYALFAGLESSYWNPVPTLCAAVAAAAEAILLPSAATERKDPNL